MKKVILSGVAMIALATAALFTTSSCSKTVEPTPTVAGVNFDTEVTGKVVFANLSQDAAAVNTGSLYSFESASSGTKCTLTTVAGFQFQEVTTGNYQVTNINKGSTAAGCLADGANMPNAVTFASTTLTYLSATAGDVSSITGFTATASVTNGAVLIYKTKAGKNGIMSVSLTDDAGTPAKKKMTFSYKTIK